MHRPLMQHLVRVFETLAEREGGVTPPSLRRSSHWCVCVCGLLKCPVSIPEGCCNSSPFRKHFLLGMYSSGFHLFNRPRHSLATLSSLRLWSVARSLCLLCVHGFVRQPTHPFIYCTDDWLCSAVIAGPLPSFCGRERKRDVSDRDDDSSALLRLHDSRDAAS